MEVISTFGRLSDRLTALVLRKQGDVAAAEIYQQRQGVIRSAQFSAIMAVSQPMMFANGINALALVMLQHYTGNLGPQTLLWAVVVVAFASSGFVAARRFRRAAPRNTASTRAPGKIAVSSLVLALIWCYPLVVILPGGNLLEAAFISALIAGMVAGGALALYPVPLAGFIYISILSCVGIIMVVSSKTLPSVPYGLITAGFSLIVAYSINRHTGMFLSELSGKLDAEHQRDMVSLLLNTYRDEDGQCLWQSDMGLKLTSAPEPLARILNLELATVRSTNLIEILQLAEAIGHDTQSQAAYSDIASHDYSRETDFEMTLKIPSGRIMKFAGKRETGENPEQLGFLGYLKDVTSEVKAAEKIYHLATRDTMTGLFNYREFKERAEALLGARMIGTEIGSEPKTAHFLFLDADNLKAVNDNFGHATGDILIETIASRLKTLLPDGSVLARKGGDEFVALVCLGSDADLTEVCATLISGVNQNLYCNGIEVLLSCSLGVSSAKGSIANLEQLEFEADRAMYVAKFQGKGQFRFYRDITSRHIYRNMPRSIELDEVCCPNR